MAEITKEFEVDYGPRKIESYDGIHGSERYSPRGRETDR